MDFRDGCGRVGPESYIYRLHSRLSQVFSDAVHDGLIARSPCSRRTSPGQGKQRAYVASTAQVWALHDEMPDNLRAAILLGAFAGLRSAEVCGLRVADVDFMRGVDPAGGAVPGRATQERDFADGRFRSLRELAATLSAHVAAWRAETLLTHGGRQLAPWTLEAPCARPGPRSPVCPRDSGITTFATTSPRC